MLIEIQATAMVLKKWRKNPKLTKREIGVWSHWSEDIPKNNLPLSSKEVKDYKDFLKKCNPTSFYNMFPEDKPKAPI